MTDTTVSCPAGVTVSIGPKRHARLLSIHLIAHTEAIRDRPNLLEVAFCLTRDLLQRSFVVRAPRLVLS